MRRNFSSVWLVMALSVLATEPSALAYPQFEAADPGQYPTLNGSYPQPQYQQPPYAQAPYPQAQDPQDIEQDPAADSQHGVARLALVQGDVSVKRGDTGALVSASVNAPLMSQDHVQTSPGSRAEIGFDYANLLRLAPNTDVGFADLRTGFFQIQLGAGTVIYRVLRNGGAQAEVDTPSVAFKPEGQGEYRIAVRDDGTTEITVRSGQGEIFGARGSQRLGPGKTILVRGSPADPEFQETYEIARDQLDDWSSTRDRNLLGSQSYRYVQSDVSGADNLDGYGDWVPSQYGQVWTPRAPAPDWSPYSDGQWAYEPYYGWTWVDAAPWGWAPYHYGRWFVNPGVGWCWWPGTRGVRASWSPALVGFFGFGGGYGFGSGGLGWVALAPFEPCHPWWGRGGYRGGYGYRDFRSVNLAVTYRNAAFRGGALASGFESFGGPHGRYLPASRSQLTGANLYRGQIPVQPTRAAYQFSSRSAVFNSRLGSAGTRPFFSRGTSGGGGFSSASRNEAGGFARQATVPANAAGSRGWQRFGDPGRSASYSQGFATGHSQEPTGWHHFGDAHGPAASPDSREGSQASFGSPRYNSGRSYPTYQSREQGSSPQRTPAPERSFTQPQRYSAPPSNGGYHGQSEGRGGGSRSGGDSHGESHGGHGDSHSASSSGGGYRGR